jgi:hypothetical protein
VTDHLVFYRESPLRKDWVHPSLEEIAESLRNAHDVNRRLVDTVNELYDAKGKTDRELEIVMKELAASKKALHSSRLKNTILTSLLTSIATTTVIAFLFDLLKRAHV